MIDFEAKDKRRAKRRRIRNQKLKRFHEERTGEYRPRMTPKDKRKEEKWNPQQILKGEQDDGESFSQ